MHPSVAQFGAGLSLSLLARKSACNSALRPEFSTYRQNSIYRYNIPSPVDVTPLRVALNREKWLTYAGTPGKRFYKTALFFNPALTFVTSPYRENVTAKCLSVTETRVGMSVEAEHVEQIADRGHVRGHIGIARKHLGVRQIVAAAMSQRLQAPIALDEFQDRDVVVIGVDHAPAFGEGRDDDEGNARPVAEEVYRLHEARIVVTAPLVKGDEQGGFGKEFWLGTELIQNLVEHPLEKIKLRARGMTVEEAVGLDKGHRWEIVVFNVIEEIDDILNVRLALIRIAHDRRCVGDEITDVAIVDGDQLVESIAWCSVGDTHRRIKAAAIIGP